MIGSSNPNAMKWFVLYVRSNNEKKVAQAFDKLEIENYAPHRTEVRQWSDRKKKVQVPLFKSYVFVRLRESERNRVFEVPGVVRYLFWLGKPAVVRDVEIDVIKNWIDGDEVDDFVLSHFSPGDQIQIKKGPMKDQQAIIQQIDAINIRLILVDMGVVLSAKLKEIL